MISVMLRPNRKSSIVMNLRAKGKQYSNDEDLCFNDSCMPGMYISVATLEFKRIL